jgi:hypothetical protein
MSDELIVVVPQNEQLPVEYQAEWDSVVSAGDFIPRIQLYGSNSNAVKKEHIAQGRYGFPKSADEIVDLGKDVPCIPLAWSFKAMQFSGSGDPPVVSYDPKSPSFLSIKEVADGGGLSGSVYGIEFLLFLTSAPTGVGNYVTLFLNSASSRREAASFRGLLGKAATLKVRLAQNKKGSWHVPVITPCSTPPANVPDSDEMHKRIEQFKNPPAPTAEMASGDEVKAQEGVVR